MFRLAAEPKRWMSVTAPVSASRRFSPACLARNVAMTRWLESQLAAIDAERLLLLTELSRAEALRQQRAATADLFRALGGGWTAPETPPPAVSQAEPSK